MLGVKIIALASDSHKTLVINAVERPSCHQRATAVVIIVTRSISILFADWNLMFDWSSTWSV